MYQQSGSSSGSASAGHTGDEKAKRWDDDGDSYDDNKYNRNRDRSRSHDRDRDRGRGQEENKVGKKTFEHRLKNRFNWSDTSSDEDTPVHSRREYSTDPYGVATTDIPISSKESSNTNSFKTEIQGSSNIGFERSGSNKDFEKSGLNIDLEGNKPYATVLPPSSTSKFAMQVKASSSSGPLGGISMKLGSAPKPKPAVAALSSALAPKSTKVAAVFNTDDDDEPEEMPAECKMRMKNVGRETPTSAGPNSFGKTKIGFCNVSHITEKKWEDQIVKKK